MESSWWQRLEQELEQQFDRFLNDHPNQKELLDQEHWNEQQRRKHQRLLGIDQEAQDLRKRLLKLSEEISGWSERVKRARTAGALDLASRAETHLSHLMGTHATRDVSLPAGVNLAHDGLVLTREGERWVTSTSPWWNTKRP